MERAWQFVWNRLFDGRTHMFYNYLVGNEADAATRFLPEPELIKLQIPNPGGYGTGMEDCMLNAGIMMDAVVARYEATGDEAMRAFASDIYRGMKLDATVSEKKGFLPRGGSPADCRSHYIDTSRDQYTNWIYGAYRFYYSDLCDEKQKESIRRILIGMSEKMEAEVIPENRFSFQREDGELGFVGQMWGELRPHEYLRLPMLYLLTWKVTGDGRWKDAYMRYRDVAVEKSLDFVPLTGPSYAALQMQYSMRLVYDLEEDAAVRAKLSEMMKRLASPYEEASRRQAAELMTPEGKAWLEIPYTSWENSKFRYSGVWGNMGYFVPEPSDFREHLSYYPLRAVGEDAAIAALCPDWKVADETLEALLKTAEFVDYEKHKTCAPISLIAGYWLAKKSRLK